MPILELYPDLTLLKKHGYVFDPNAQIDFAWTREQKTHIEENFKFLAENYGILDYYDTILYIILVRHDDAERQLQHIHKVYKDHMRVKELAQLLSVYEPRRKSRPEVLKVASKLDTFKLTDPVLIEWLGSIVKEAIEKGRYVSSQLGHAIMDFTRNEQGEVLAPEQKLDYRQIASYATQSIRKPTIRERNEVLAIFLLFVYDFLQQETTLRAPEATRFTDNQLNFLYKLSVLFNWFPEDRPGDVAEDKDYMYALLLNFIKARR